MHCAPTHQPGPPPDSFEPWEIELVRGIVQGFLATSGDSPVLGFDDLVQECLIHWWLRRERYREEREASRRTYMRRVLNARLVDLRREAQAAKRGSGRITDSLDRELGEEKEDGLALGDLVPGNVDVEAESSLRVDLQRVAALLTRRQLIFIRELSAEKPVTEISQRMGVSRDTLYQELRRIRGMFQDAGLEEYLR